MTWVLSNAIKLIGETISYSYWSIERWNLSKYGVKGQGDEKEWTFEIRKQD